MANDVGFVEALFVGKNYASEGLDFDAEKYFWGAPTGINWCEGDFEYLWFVAEFWNTVSNFGFVLVGAKCLFLVRDLRLPGRFAALGWAIILTGIFSAGFHATLLWTQQKLDESAENLVLVILFHSDRATQSLAIAHGAVAALGIFTIAAFLFCELHLIAIVIATLFKVKSWVNRAEVVSKGRDGLHRTLRIAAISAIVGAICWLVDRLACSVVSKLFVNPQLHAWWHIFSAIALHEGFVLAAALFQIKDAIETGLEIDLEQPLIKSGFLGLSDPLSSDYFLRKSR